MTTRISASGEIRLPPKLRKRKRIRAGDDFQLLEDEDDPSIIILRKLPATRNTGLVEHLLGCPYKGWFKAPSRSREPLRKARL